MWTFDQWLQLVSAGSSLLMAISLVIAWREYQARKPALAAQAQEANASVLSTSIAELRQQRAEDKAAMAELREQLANSKRDQHFRDIEQDKASREQAAKMEALEAKNAELERDLNTEREARKRDVTQLQNRVSQLEEENRLLRAENTQLKEENAGLKKPKSTPRARKPKEKVSDQSSQGEKK
jgi:valyl-tRNA synthetase